MTKEEVYDQKFREATRALNDVHQERRAEMTKEELEQEALDDRRRNT